MEIKTSKLIKGFMYEIPNKYVPFHYLDAFNLLYKFENSLRVFVYAILKSDRGNNWADTKIKKDGKTISDTFKERKSNLEEYGHIGVLPNIPMLYLTLDDLVSIIMNIDHRALFKPHFPASLGKVYQTKFWEVIILRNNLVHFRKFTEKDFKRLIDNMEDLAPLVGSYLEKLLNGDYSELIPSQKDDWYPSWISVSLKDKKYASFFLQTSKCKGWIVLVLSVNTMTKTINDTPIYYNISSEMLFQSIRDVLPYAVYFIHGVTPIELSDAGASNKFLRITCHPRQFIKNANGILALFSELIDRIESEYRCVIGKEIDEQTKQDSFIEHRYEDYSFDYTCEAVSKPSFLENWTNWQSPRPFNVFEGDSPWID